MDEPSVSMTGMLPGLESRPYQSRIVRRAIDLFTGAAHDKRGELEPATVRC